MQTSTTCGLSILKLHETYFPRDRTATDDASKPCTRASLLEMIPAAPGQRESRNMEFVPAAVSLRGPVAIGHCACGTIGAGERTGDQLAGTHTSSRQCVQSESGSLFNKHWSLPCPQTSNCSPLQSDAEDVPPETARLSRSAARTATGEAMTTALPKTQQRTTDRWSCC